MLIVISLILMLLILGGTVLMISTGHFSTSHHRIARTKAYYAAEAAIQYAFWALRTGNASFPVGSSIEIDLPSDDTKANYFDVNGLTATDITVTVNTEVDGVYPIEVEVTY